MIEDKKLKLKLDYQETLTYFHALADARFKLLALLPIVTGVAIAALARSDQPELVIPLSIFGIFVTVGVMFYDQRNTQIYNAMQIRAKSLEVMFGFPPLTNLTIHNRQGWRCGGAWVYNHRHGKPKWKSVSI